MASWRSQTKRAGSRTGAGSVSQRYVFADPDLWKKLIQAWSDKFHDFFLHCNNILEILGRVILRCRLTTVYVTIVDYCVNSCDNFKIFETDTLNTLIYPTAMSKDMNCYFMSSSMPYSLSKVRWLMDSLSSSKCHRWNSLSNKVQGQDLWLSQIIKLQVWLLDSFPLTQGILCSLLLQSVWAENLNFDDSSCCKF